MSNELERLREDAWNLLSTPTSNLLGNYLQKHSSIARLATVGEAEEIQQEPKILRFSIFNHLHLREAEKIWNLFFEIADRSNTTTEAIKAVRDTYLELLDTKNPELLYHSLMVFIAHHPVGRVLSVPSILVRDPGKVVPSKPLGATLNTASGRPNILAALIEDEDHNQETLLNWFREDPLANEHHQHWHVVYPAFGLRGGIKDRQGELFIYMHQQMLARYDAERIAVGIERVLAHSDYNASIAYGYNPGAILTNSAEINITPFFTVTRFTPRKPGPMFKNFDDETLKEKVAAFNNLKEKFVDGVKKGRLKKGKKEIAISPHLLGSTLEPSLDSTDEEYYETKVPTQFGLHGTGHLIVAFSENPTVPDMERTEMGVMGDPATAIRDPFFWAWHKHIDDFSFNWQQTQKKHDFSDYPNVLIRKGIDEVGDAWSPDIILSTFSALRNIPGLTTEKGTLNSEVLKRLAAQAFGGNNWNGDFTKASSLQYQYAENKKAAFFETVDELKTWMEKGKIRFLSRSESDPKSSEYAEFEYEYLNHEEFFYFVRIQNQFNYIQKVTVRIFLVPASEEEDRRAWIEMDKFVHELQANERAVVVRKAEDSSVIRKPAIKNPDTDNVNYKPRDINLTDPELFIKMAADVKYNEEGNIAQYKEFLDSNFSQSTKVLADFADYNEPTPNVNREMEAVKLAKEAAEACISNITQFKINLKIYEEALFKVLKAVQSFIYNKSYCECGWPYNLLLPRGTTDGMKFKLMVMITDWQKDIVGEEDCCGSMSYCGAKDRYPDVRPMGYPFDRAFEGSIKNLIALQPNMACRSITIKLNNDGIQS
ncbi:hemocyanin-like protein [Pontibacter ummariensis]|uniref:Hemocyanin, ig-like domain n=1 Tax=Pontibacter ummariensis TaxID=1610492 RepID=A0A239FWM2_9BACT|nr:tyrosinase family protein [Pontibacter ummariensis]PRY11889.1 hemocyanin-like protein [Pontibacter ummariensis]SNS61289.1 Hemocyanin, ig-like domain [Pontibacter ummariensis]